MKVLDKFERVAEDSAIVAVVLGNIATSDFELVDPSSAPLTPDVAAAFHARHLEFIGATALGFDGKFRSALAVPLDDATVDALGTAFVQYVLKKLRSKCDGSAAWLRDLWKLSDTREN